MKTSFSPRGEVGSRLYSPLGTMKERRSNVPQERENENSSSPQGERHRKCLEPTVHLRFGSFHVFLSTREEDVKTSFSPGGKGINDLPCPLRGRTEMDVCPQGERRMLSVPPIPLSPGEGGKKTEKCSNRTPPYRIETFHSVSLLHHPEGELSMLVSPRGETGKNNHFSPGREERKLSLPEGRMRKIRKT